MSEIRHFVHRPSSHLRPFVREILWVSSDRERVQMLLPETTLTMVLRQSGEASLNGENLPRAVISGLQQRARAVCHGANSSVIVVRFTEVGAPAILHDRADIMYARTAALDGFVPPQSLEHLQNQLADAHTMDKQIVIAESFLADRLRPPNGAGAQIEAAARLIRESGGTTPITMVARRVAMSQSAFERHFRAISGTTPKMFSRLARLQRVCRLWDAGRNLTTIAFEAGYTDQPHFVRDFQLFTGMAPEQFFRTHSPRNLPTFYK